MKKTGKTFKKSKCPRYLPGSVPKSKLTSDLKQFNNHRYNVKSLNDCVIISIYRF